jgi:hypothetical protein
MSCQSHPPSLHSNYTWRKVQVMKLLLMLIYPASRCFTPLRSKYSPRQPVLKHLSLYSSLNIRH